MLSIKILLKHKPLTHRLATGLLLVALLAGCANQVKTPVPGPSEPSGKGTATAPASTEAPPTETVAPTPSFTPEPLALKVNGQGLSLAEFQAELTQLQAANQELGEQGGAEKTTAEQDRQQVIDSLVDSMLLSLAAAQEGYTLDDSALDQEIQKIAAQRGEAALREWQAKMGYTEASFRSAMRRSMAAAWERDKILASVPEQVEQVHARQILVSNEETAQTIYGKVKTPGTNFADYAFGYDPQIGGDLGWFPRGYLIQPEVEAAAFALEPGQISDIVHSKVGYHIIQLIARETRPLSPDARRVLQHTALQDWLNERRKTSQVEILVP